MRKSTWVIIGIVVVALVAAVVYSRPGGRADAWLAAGAARWIMKERPTEKAVLANLGPPEDPARPPAFDPAKLVPINITGELSATSARYYHGRLEVYYDERDRVASIGVAPVAYSWLKPEIKLPASGIPLR